MIYSDSSEKLPNNGDHGIDANLIARVQSEKYIPVQSAVSHRNPVSLFRDKNLNEYTNKRLYFCEIIAQKIVQNAF